MAPRIWACLCSFVVAMAASAGPPGDYGDAPVGNLADNVPAYPGVLARWPTRFNHTNTVILPQRAQGAWLNSGATARLGTVGPSLKTDSTLTPGPPENDAAPVILVWPGPPNPGPNPLASLEVTVTTSPGHDASQPVYLNIWIDQNRDGQWKDGYLLATPLIAWNLEWIAQDIPVMMPAGTTARVSIAPIRLEDPLNSHWLRAMVSNEPVGAAFRGPGGSLSGLWDSTMTAAHPFRGEIEDHLLSFRTDDPGPVPTPGVWYYRQYRRQNPPGGGPPPKPACVLTYRGPWLVFPPRCPARLVTTLGCSSCSVNGGCARAPALWGMYGLLRIAGFPSPPTVALRFPVPAGAIPGVLAMPCPPPLVGALGLPAAIPGEGPLMASVQIPVNQLANPPRLQITSCYTVPPRRFRVYRAFFHHDTCGSLHVNRTVHTHPASGMTLAAIISDGPGRPADYCDFAIGDLEENFVDEAEDRAYPDPDFSDVTIAPIAPGGGAGLDAVLFVSPPSSLRVQGAVYLVSPAIPDRWHAASVRLKHRGGLATLTFTDAAGTVLTASLAPAPTWVDFEQPMPAGFRLQSVAIECADTLNVDDLIVSLRPADPCLTAAPIEWPATARAGQTATYRMHFGPGSEPFPGPSPWERWLSADDPLLTSDEEAALLWAPLLDGQVLPGGTSVSIHPDGSLELSDLSAADFIGRKLRVRAAPVAPCGATTSYDLLTTLVGCNLADITEIGGTPDNPGNPDDQLTVDDVIFFINLFSDATDCPGDAPCNLADVCGIGGPPELPDGQLTVDDVIAFVNAFSDGC